MTPLASEAGSGRLGRRCITHVLRDIGSATSITHVLVGDVSRMYCAGVQLQSRTERKEGH